MSRYVATFHNDFGAIGFQRRLNKLGDKKARLIPVPRQVSASCGLGVEFFLPFEAATMPDEYTEGVYLETDGEYKLLFENS